MAVLKPKRSIEDSALAIPRAVRFDVNPSAVYLARIGAGSRRAQTGALETIAAALSGGRAGVYTLDWAAVRYQHAQAVRSWLVERLAPRTVNRFLAALRGVTNEAWKLGAMPAEECERIRSIEGVKVDGPPAGREVVQEELRALLAAGTPRDSAMLALLYGAGLRRAEASGIQTEDVDLETGQLRIHGKGGRTRIAAVPIWALELLKTWAAVRCGPPGAFLTGYARGRSDGRGIGPQALHDALRRLAGRARISASFSAHDLRRTWVGDMLDSGAELVHVQQLAGHADPRTTSRYDRRDARSRTASARRLPDPTRREPGKPVPPV